MVVKSISFVTEWEDNPSIENQNIDVFVELEDGYTYVLVAATPKNIEYLMEKDKMNYFGPHHPYLIVKKLTEDIIEEAVKAYAEESDEYWLKFYHFAGNIPKIVFDKLRVEHMKKLRDEKLNE